MKHQIIPDSLNLFIFIIAIIFSFFNPVFGDKPFARFLVSLGSAVLLGVIFIFVSYLASLIFKKEALGGGDIKLICAMSALLGIQRSFMAIFLASLSGSVIGILLILSKRKARGEYIPFGPFLAFGAYLALLLPDTFLIW
jgi:leader peptidase (prepilin peptidase)/N-methyltransferase